MEGLHKTSSLPFFLKFVLLYASECLFGTFMKYMLWLLRNATVINNTNTSKGVGVSTAWPRGNATAGELLEMKAVQTGLSVINSHFILMFCKMLLIIDYKYSSYK